MDFKNIYELQKRVMPALKKRASDLTKQGIEIFPEDIWTNLKNNKWIKTQNLSLNEIVNDILKYEPKN